MIKAVLYDMDGTVLDTMPFYERSWAYADEVLGGGGKLVAMIPHISGMNNNDCKTYVLTRMGEDFPYTEFRRLMRGKMAEIIESEGITCKAGAPEIFDTLRTMGIKQILVTSSPPKAVHPYLESVGITNAFDGIITGDMVEHSKPDPEIFLLGAKLAGCEPHECVVVEDAFSGARAGIAGGMLTVMIPEYPPIPKDVAEKLWHECKSLSELSGLIEEYNRTQQEE